MVSGWQALTAGRPDMNSLVGLGAAASFGVSCAAAALPALRWKTFFEEPAMLLGEWVGQAEWPLAWLACCCWLVQQVLQACAAAGSHNTLLLLLLLLFC
jgi:hypothetical protein